VPDRKPTTATSECVRARSLPSPRIRPTTTDVSRSLVPVCVYVFVYTCVWVCVCFVKSIALFALSLLCRRRRSLRLCSFSRPFFAIAVTNSSPQIYNIRSLSTGPAVMSYARGTEDTTSTRQTSPPPLTRPCVWSPTIIVLFSHAQSCTATARANDLRSRLVINI